MERGEREEEFLRQPLLYHSAPHISDALHSQTFPHDHEGQLSEWAQQNYVNQSSLRKPASVEVNAVVTANEIKAAASDNLYPTWIFGALITPVEQERAPELMPLNYQEEASQPHSVPLLEEGEIRELLLDHIGHHSCWGHQPARKWRIRKVEDCSSYLGTLETFIEEREVLEEVEPHTGGAIESINTGRAPGAWEVDMKEEFPLLFVSRKEAWKKLPYSEVADKCPDCSGRGEVFCTICNQKSEPGEPVVGKMTLCANCRGRGLVAHMDGSDSYCPTCKGKGNLPCFSCSSRGLIKCEKCRGEGGLLKRKILHVKWKTLMNRRVSATSNAITVPDEVFRRAKGVQIHHSQSVHCEPAIFPNAPALTTFSAEVVAERTPPPPTSRIICERHQISLIPITRIVMGKRERSFTFYIIGLSREIYLKDYPARSCWGLCNCM